MLRRQGRGDRGPAGPPVVAHVSSVHRVSDTRIHLREARSLVEAGLRVHLFANHHDVALPETGVQVHTFRLPGGRFGRLVLAGPWAVIRALCSGSQVVHLHDPELAWAIPLLRVLGRKVIYDAHEDLPVQVLSKPYLNALTRPVAVLAARLIVRMVAKADHVVAATEVIGRSFPAQKTALVRNYPVLRDGEAHVPLDERRLAVGYVGALGETRGVTTLVQSLTDSAFPPGWRAVIAGPAISPDYLDRLRQEPGWVEKVDYRGHLSSDEARDLLDDIRVGIVTLQRTPAYLDSLPTKMFEYFAAGVPAVASDFPLWRDIIHRHECGILVDEESPAAIAAAVGRYAEDPELLRRHGDNARRAALETLNWSGEARTLVGVYESLLGPWAGPATG